MWLVLVLLATDMVGASTIYVGAMWAGCINENRLFGNQSTTIKGRRAKFPSERTCVVPNSANYDHRVARKAEPR